MSRTQVAERPVSSTVRIRQAGAADLAALGEFFSGLPDQTRYLRFFGPLAVTPAMLRRLAGGGGIDSVVAAAGDTIIGHAMAADRAGQPGLNGPRPERPARPGWEPGPGSAGLTEIGVVVTDAWQGRGIGSALVRTLFARARARGVTGVTMDVLPANRRALRMIADHWPVRRTERSPDCLTITAALPPP